MPATHKDICRHAQGILANYLAKDVECVAKFQDPKNNSIDVAKEITANVTQTFEQLIQLFDGPTQWEADANHQMTMWEFQDAACRTLAAPGYNHWFEAPRGGQGGMYAEEEMALFAKRIDLLHAILGVCGEAGEKADPIKKSMFYGKKLDEQNIREEAGNLLWYIAGPLCRALGCTLEDLARDNVAKLKLRYPEKYTDQAAIERADKL